MSSFTAGSPVPPPPPSAGSAVQPVDGRGRPLPRWSTLDTWPVFVLVILAFLTLLQGSSEAGESAAAEVAELAPAALFFGVLVQQAVQFAWPWIVSRWKGLGLIPDWRFQFKWARDPGIGVLLTIGALIVSSLVSWLVSIIVGLEATENASNTSVITDHEGSPWLIGIISLVILGAPLSEELLFRGLCLRALEKDMGVIVGVVGSALLFTIPHAQPGATGAESAVLLSSLFAVGLLWGWAAVRFNRLGPVILSHVFFNAFGTVMALLA